MIIGMKNRERERTAADLNQEMSPDSNTDQNHDADFSEVFEESEESIGTSLSDILRQAVTGTGSADRASGRSHNRGSRRDSDHRKKSLIRENVIEREFVKAVHLAGGIAYKFALPEVQGMPDRLVLFPSGASFFVEFITPEKVLNPMWTLRRRQLEYLGYSVICIDHLEQIIPVIKAILTWTPGETFPEKGEMKGEMKGLRHRRMEEDESSELSVFSDSEERERDSLRQVIRQLQRAAYQQLQIQKMEDMLIREKRREQERRKGRMPINTDCEFHDWKDNKDICRIHMDMQFCSRDCAFATTGAGSTAPYGTKYMKGRL
jgi:hypothetical protein